ncbi:MAG: protein kinase [Polyangiaceae bacterium]
MEIDILRGELERHFSLDEMMALSRDLLGLLPEEIGATTSSATFARALVTHCLEVDSLDALADAIAISRTEVDPKIREATVHGFAAEDELSTGAKLGDYNIVRKLGEGPLGHVYVARKDETEFVLKVVRTDVAVDRRRIRRLLTHARIVSQIDHEALPRSVSAGFVGGRAYIAYAHTEGQTLASKIGRTGPMHLNEARPLLKSILEPLALIHEKRLSHGNIKGENVLLTRGEAGAQKVILLDSGSDRLRRRVRSAGTCWAWSSRLASLLMSFTVARPPTLEATCTHSVCFCSRCSPASLFSLRRPPSRSRCFISRKSPTHHRRSRLAVGSTKSSTPSC